MCESLCLCVGGREERALLHILLLKIEHTCDPPSKAQTNKQKAKKKINDSGMCVWLSGGKGSVGVPPLLQRLIKTERISQ